LLEKQSLEKPSVLDIVSVLTDQVDYTKTRNYWKYLKSKFKKENNELVSRTNQLKLQAADGKDRFIIFG
jgi:cell filamentation protein